MPTYFASFLLCERPEIAPPTVAEVLEYVANWLFNNPHRKMPRSAGWPNTVEPLVFPKVRRFNSYDDKMKMNQGMWLLFVLSTWTKTRACYGARTALLFARRSLFLLCVFR